MEETVLEQLGQICDDAKIDQGPNIICCALGQLLPFDPFCHVYPSRGVLRIIVRDNDGRQYFHLFPNLETILALQVVVQLLIKSVSKFIQQRHSVQPVSKEWEVPSNKAGLPGQVKIKADRFQHTWPLNLDGNSFASLPQRGLVNLSKRSLFVEGSGE